MQLMILLIKRRKLKKDTKNKAKKHLLSQFNKLLRDSSIRVLSHAVQGHPSACNTLVDSNGLGSVFGILMLRPKGLDETATAVPGYVLSVLHHCFMYLNQERKTRLLRKFLENDFEKAERLIEFFLKVSPPPPPPPGFCATTHHLPGGGGASTPSLPLPRAPTPFK